jgi:cobalt/nickel transport system permease protein
MHIPDGFLDAKTAIATGMFSAAGLGTALRHTRRHLHTREIPLIGLTAAFIFVAQMLNFPVAGGTSGHLIGATLAVVLLGPSVAVIVMSSVLIIQALIFADGGLLALGANIFNMALVAPLCSFIVYRIIRKVFQDNRGQIFAAAAASWCATIIAAVFCAGELAWSGTAQWSVVFPAMAGIHAFIGIGEALITMLVLAAIGTTRPELLEENSRSNSGKEQKAVVLYGILIILGLLIFVVPFASKLPDGLERVAKTFGFENKAMENQSFSAPLKNYRFYGFELGETSSILAGFIGASGVFVFLFVLSRIIIPKPKKMMNSKTPLI